MFHRHRIRVLLAYVQVTLLIAIIISGMLFVHKHKTSTGEIVVHNHPYNLKDDPETTPHHQSEDEIHFLDVVFSGSFVEYESVKVEFPVEIIISQSFSAPITEKLQACEISHYYLRGPPKTI